MKIVAFAFLFILFSFSSIVFPQDIASNPKQEVSNDVRLDEKLKADILDDIKTLPNKSRSQYYAKLAQIYWTRDQKERSFWLTKAIDNALSPATDYQNSKEKVDILAHILVSFDVFEKDAALGQKLLGAITETLYDEVKTKGSDEFNAKLINLADHIFETNQQLAFDLAMLSLKGKKPVINHNTIHFFRELALKDEALSNRFFDGLTALVRNGDDRILLHRLMEIDDLPLNSWELQPNLTDAQKTKLLEVLASFIQKESAELAAKKRTDCVLTHGYGIPYFADYKKLLSIHTAMLEQAIGICRTADIEPWKKPDFFKNRSLKTSQELLDFAKELTDKPMQTRWLYSAALRAESEKNYKFGISILDDIEPSERKPLYEWEMIRAQITGRLVIEFLQSDNVEEANLILKNAPPEIRPNVISRVIFDRATLKNKDKLKYDLLNQMRTILENPDFYSNDRTRINSFQPDAFFRLAHEYFYSQKPDEALSLLENYAKLQNQMSRRFPEDSALIEIFGFSIAPVFPGNLVEKNTQKIYQIISGIEPVRMRLKLRCILLHETVNRFDFRIPISRKN